ncbi:anion transporter, partial [Lactobacillus delbrueckii subsp. bulgaricus]|nr:anion transporter [Lactobacillus delbrueckii subsp. bulgaricus]
MINKIYHAGFLSIALGAGVPKIMAALMLAFCGSVFLSTSTYSAGPAAM